MSEQRDELAVFLANHDTAVGNFVSWAKTYDGRAAAILAAGWTKPRTITTVEELDALPVGSIVIDSSEYVGRKERDSSRLPNWAATLHKFSKDASAFDFPVTVLCEPAAPKGEGS